MTSDAFNDLIQGLALPNATEVPTPQHPVPTVTPVPLALDLLDYQQEAVGHALRNPQVSPYAYVALDMGLGKTPVGIALVAALSAANIKKSLVVVPPSLRINWRKEFHKFAPWLKVGIIKGSTPEDGEVIPEHLDALIIGDSTLTGWADFLTGKVGSLIVDEAHRFKNDSKRADALKQLSSGEKKLPPAYKGAPSKRVVLATGSSLPFLRVMMSGTPIPNGRHTELPSQVDVLGEGAWKDIGGKGMFWHHYAPKVTQWQRGNNDGVALFKAMSSTWYFRRLRDDVLDLPNKGRSALSLEAQGVSSIKRYMDAHKDIIAYLAGKQSGKVSHGQVRAQALIKLNTLRRLAGECKVRSTVEHVKDILDNEPGGVFIVAEHTDVINDLMIGLGKYQPVSVQGGMGDAEKDAAVVAFNSGQSRVLVGQITAAGVGLTLHGDGLNHRVIVAQLPWTPAELKQAEDRLHRIGQTHDVTVEVALCAIDGVWTVDERLWGMLEAKNFSSTTITDGAGEYLLDTVVDGLLDSYR